MAAKVLNLGLGGAGFACAAILRPEERLTVTLISPSLLDPLVAPARVAWIRPAEDAALLYGGLTFEAVDRGVLLTLFQLIGGVTP